MSTVAGCVDLLFAKLTMVYGSTKAEAFFKGVDIAEAKRYWVHELRGFTMEDIFYAMDHLPPEGIPNVLQFKALCRRRPMPLTRRIEAPLADPARVAEAITKLQELKKAITSNSNPTAWMDRLEARMAAGEKLSRYQLECLAEGRRRYPKRSSDA